MGYFDHEVRSALDDYLDDMTDEELNAAKAHIEELIPDVRERRIDRRLKHLDIRCDHARAALSRYEDRQDLLYGVVDGNCKSLRRLSTAVVALAAGWVAYVTMQIILSLV